jgi:hypothetical protein
MSFMAVAYVPAYLEDRAVFVKDRANGLYGPFAFMLSNIIVGLPYLCKLLRALSCPIKKNTTDKVTVVGISLLFSTIAYWLSNF